MKKGSTRGQLILDWLSSNGRIPPGKVRIDPHTGCWEYDSVPCNKGYKKISARHGGKHHKFLAHHVFFIQHNNRPIRNGLTLDHVCRNTGCVCPHHLEEVSIAENSRRKYSYTEPQNIPFGDEIKRAKNGKIPF